jgi:hypothetical protein
MTHWTYSGNAKFREGKIYLSDEPIWLYLVYAVWQHIIGYGCVWLPGILGGWWHRYICDPIFQWYVKRSKKYEYTIEIEYDKLKEVFENHDKDYFKMLEKVEDVDD